MLNPRVAAEVAKAVDEAEPAVRAGSYQAPAAITAAEQSADGALVGFGSARADLGGCWWPSDPQAQTLGVGHQGCGNRAVVYSAGNHDDHGTSRVR